MRVRTRACVGRGGGEAAPRKSFTERGSEFKSWFWPQILVKLNFVILI